MTKEFTLAQAEDLEALLKSLEENAERWGVVWKWEDFHFYDEGRERQ